MMENFLLHRLEPGNDARMEKAVRVGVATIVRKDRKILLLCRKNVHGQGTWSTPGGHLEFGETPEHCAVRETKEESGIVVENPRFYALTNDFFPERQRHYVTIWMEADFVSGEPNVTAEYESDRVEWWNLDNLPSPLFLPFQKVIQGNTLPGRTLVSRFPVPK